MSNEIPPRPNTRTAQALDQPSRDAILIDDTHAVMTRYTLAALHEYNTSQPTGVWPGKMWRWRERKMESNGAITWLDSWWLCWYGDAYMEKNRRGEYVEYCVNEHRRILIVE